MCLGVARLFHEGRSKSVLQSVRLCTRAAPRRSSRAWMNELSELLRFELKRRDIAQGGAARVLGTSQQQVSRWIDGARPGRRFWPALADFLDLSEQEVERACPGSRRRSR